MPDGVLVAPAALLDDGLGVVDHEAAEDEEAAPQVQLEQGGAPATGRKRREWSLVTKPHLMYRVRHGCGWPWKRFHQMFILFCRLVDRCCSCPIAR